MNDLSVREAITSRMSVRAFTPEPVPKDMINQILATASRAPSGTNTQPWKAYVLTGASRDELCQKVCAVYDRITANPELEKEYQPSYDYYPETWFSPYIDRRRENGWGLYGLLGIAKGERDKMRAQHRKNFELFGAPVALMFTLDKRLGRGSMLDYGMFLQNIMLAARAFGLETCPQAAWSSYAKIILPHIGAGEHEMFICGIAMGFADKNDKVNTFKTPRVPPEDFTVWLD
jgi:nitroreductase